MTMIPQAITIPRHRDPIARILLFACVGLVAWIAVVQPTPQRADAGEIIILPTPPLPIGQVDRALAAPVQQAAPTIAPAPTQPPPAQVQVVDLAPPTPQPIAEPPAGGQPITAEQPQVNPWQGMETVNGHLFVPTPDRYAGMDSVNYAYVSPEDYNSLPTITFDNAPPAPTAAPDARDYQYSRQRTR